MKPSNNALTFLRAQYRAIYGRAYFKGLASIMVVSSALATPVAHAALTNNNDSDASNATSRTATTDATDELNLRALLNGEQSSLSATEQAAATASEIAYNSATQQAQNLLQPRALPTAAPAVNGDPAATPMPMAAGDPTGPGLDWDTFPGNTGDTQNYVNSNRIYNSNTWYHHVNIASGATVNVVTTNSGNQAYDNYSKLIVGSDDDESTTTQLNMAAGSTLNLNDNTALQINGNGSNTLGGNINLNAVSEGSQAIISVGMATPTAEQVNNKITVGGNINVGSGAGTAAIYAPNIDLQGDITVNEGGTLLLDGALKDINPTDLNANHGAGTFTGHSTDVTIAEGGRVVVGKGDTETGTKSKLDLGDGTSNLSGTGTLEVQGTAVLTETILDNFTTATGPDPNAPTGNVYLTSGGRLELKAGNGQGSAAPIELTDYQFGTTEGEGQINVNASGDTNTLAGDNLSVSSSIAPEGGQDLNLDLEATDLTLGGGTGFNSAEESLGYRTAVTQNVTFKPDADTNQTFHLQDGVTLDGGAHNGQAGTGTGTSTGDVVLVGGANNLDNAYRVAQGNYTHSGSITLSGGTLAVGANDNYSGDATMALNGDTTKLVIDNTNAANTIVIASNTADSNAVLDLSSGSATALELKRGNNLTSIQIGTPGTLDGTGSSELKLTADQFNTLLNVDKASGNGANVVLAGNGVLQVPNGAGTTDPNDPSNTVANLATSQLKKITNNNQATQTDMIYFNQGGRLQGEDLQLRNDGTNLDIGQGTVAATNRLDLVQNGTTSGDFVITSGNIETSDLTSTDGSVATVQVGNGNADPAQVTLTAKADGSTGNIGLNININGDGPGESSLNFKNGTWNVDATEADHSITLTGPNAHLNIGDDRETSGADVTISNLEINQSTVNIAGNSDLSFTGVTDLSDGNLTGTGDLHVKTGATTILNEDSLSTFTQHGTTEPAGGRVILEGGELDLEATDTAQPIVLNDYSQGAADSDNADIVVTQESTIGADALTVNDKLKDEWKDTVNLKVGDLYLGGKADTEYNASLNFKEATVSNSVTFSPTTNTDTENPAVADTNFYLRDHITINAVNNGNGDQATSTGDVHIRDLGTGNPVTDEPTYQVLGGTVTHVTTNTTTDQPGQFDISNAGVQIGGADNTSTAFGHDATLQFAHNTDAGAGNTSVTDVTIASGSSIKVLGNGGDSTSTLDLTGANAIHVTGTNNLINVGTTTAEALANGSTKVELAEQAGIAAPADSVFAVQDTQLSELLQTGADGTRDSAAADNVTVVLGQTGALRIDATTVPSDPADPGSPQVPSNTSLDISFLGTTDTSANPAPTLDGNKIYFDRGGRIEGDALSLTQNNTTTNVNLNIGEGTISADNLAFSNSYNGGSDFVVEQGTLEVGSSLNGMNGSKLQLGTGSGSGEANLNLGTFDATLAADGTGNTLINVTPDSATTAGDVNTTIVMAGNAAVNVNAGTWNLNNIEVSGTGNTINVGFEGNNGEVPTIDNGDGTSSVLTAEVTAESINVGDGNTLNINTNGIATFTDYENTSGGTTIVDGKLVIADEGQGSFLEGTVSGSGEIEVQGTAYLTHDLLNTFTGNSGTFTLNEGTADFTLDPNAATLDMNQFTFSEDYANPDADFNIIATKTESGADGTPVSVPADASVIKGTDVLISNSLVENNQVSAGTTDQLNLDIHATDVTLGGGENFNSAEQVFGYHQLVTQNATFKTDSGAAADTAFTLHDGIAFVATDETTGQATTGTSTGNVIVKGGTDDDFKSFNVAAGHITHSGDLTLDGGSLMVGTTEETRTNLDVADADASFTMTTGSKLTIDNTNAPNSIKVQSNGYGSTSTLNLSQIDVDLKRGNNLTTITVGSGEMDVHAPTDALLQINNADGLLDLDSTPTADQQGVAVVLTGNGALEMVNKPGEQAVLDVSNIDGYSTTPQSDRVIFSGGGMIIGQDFKVTNQDANTDKALDLGLGTIKAEKLTLDNAFKNADGTNANLALAAGRVIVGQELSSTSNTIQIGNSNSNTDYPAELHLGYFATQEAGSSLVDESAASKSTGVVNGNLIIDGNNAPLADYNAVGLGQVNTNAVVHVDYGKWTVADPTGTPESGQSYALGDVTVQNGGFLEIGAVDGTGAPYALESEDINGDGIPEVNYAEATLQGDELLLDGAMMAVHKNGHAYFNSYSHTNGSVAIIEGESYFNGEVNIDTNPDSVFYIIGRNAGAYHDRTIANNQIHVDDASDTVTTSGINKVYVLGEGGTLGFDMAASNDFSLNQIQQLRQQLIHQNTGEVVEGGYIDLGDATTSAVAVTEKSYQTQGITRGEIDYTTSSGDLAAIKDMVFANTSHATLTNVGADDVLDVGTVGNIEVDNGGQYFTVKDVDLANASASPYTQTSTSKDKYFAVNKGGKLIGANVQSEGHLGLHHGGTISTINLADGTADKDTELVIKSENDETTNITAINSSGDNTVVAIFGKGNTIVGGNISEAGRGTIDVGTLDVNANLQTSDAITVKRLESTYSKINGSPLLNADSLKVDGTTNYYNQLSVFNDATFNATAQSLDGLEVGADGATSLHGQNTFRKNVDFNGATFLAATSNTTVNGTANFNGETSLAGDLTLGASGQANFVGYVEQAATSTFNASGAGNKVSFDNSADSSKASVLGGSNNFYDASFKGNHLISGTLDAETVTVDGKFQILGENAVANVTNLYGTDTNTVIQVGQDSQNPVDNPSGGSYDTATGSLQVTNLDLKGGTLYVDPDYGEKTAFAAIDNVAAGVNGNIIVGKNAVVGFGGDLTDLETTIANYQTDEGSLDPSHYGAILVVNKPITVQDGHYIAVTSADEQKTVAEVEKWRGDDDMVLSDNSAIIINMEAFNAAANEAQQLASANTANGMPMAMKAAGSSASAGITFENNGATVRSEGGTVILNGAYDATKTTQVFQTVDNTGVTVVGKDIEVRSQSDRFIATINTGENRGAVEFIYNDNANNSGTSDVIDDAIKDNFENGQSNNSSGSTGTGNSNTIKPKPYSSYLQQIAQTDAKALESTSRLSTFGGAVAASLRTGQAAAEAMQARFTPQAQGSSTVGIWATPTYVRTEGDGYNADGLSYGHNMDLTGMSLGAEVNLNPTMKLGAMVSIGTGSADGKGAASTVSNDFDYYGAGVYVGADNDSFSVIGDLSYTVVDNDVTDSNAADKTSASFDSTNLSAGVTGKMKLNLGGFNVAPHVGMRYSRVEVDDYGIKSNLAGGTVAQSTSSTMNLLSIPVGVEISRDIQLSTWSLKPMVDFTVTGNFGDTDFNNSVSYQGIKPINLQGEVVDDITYGVKAGLEASSGALKFGIGVGYTGSDKSDELNVGANIKYEF